MMNILHDKCWSCFASKFFWIIQMDLEFNESCPFSGRNSHSWFLLLVTGSGISFFSIHFCTF